jgi:hypothetical protein
MAFQPTSLLNIIAASVISTYEETLIAVHRNCGVSDGV